MSAICGIVRSDGRLIEDETLREMLAHAPGEAYDRRPKACGAYKCTLLQEAQRGTRSFGEAHRIVEQVREIMGRIYGVIGERNPGQRIWEQAHTFLSGRWKEGEEAFRRENAALFLDLNVLALLCGRHFEAENFRGPGGGKTWMRARTV